MCCKHVRFTALPIEPPHRPPPGQTWTRDDEHVHGAMTPLSASVFIGALDRSFAAVAEQAGLLMETAKFQVFGSRLYRRIVPLGNPKTD